MEDLLALEACVVECPTSVSPAVREIVTPLCWEVWDSKLAQHPDQRFRHYIVEGIKGGFRLGFDYSRPLRGATRNMASVQKYPQAIRDYLAEECAAGRIVGPLPQDAIPGVQISRFGLIPKKTPGEWRLIVDLSSPEGASVNDGVYEHLCSLKYASVEDALRIIVTLGRGTLLAKVDIRKAYRNIPVSPADRRLLGMVWEDNLFIDTALPFGLRSAPKIFSAVADAAEWVVRKEGVNSILHYLNDFLTLGRPGSEECARSVDTLLKVFQELGLPVATSKSEGPTTCLSFLGIEIDT